MRTLIVDDSRFIREFLKEHLGPLGAVCTEAEDGRQALATLRGASRFDLMLMDVNMPGMDGVECLMRVRQESLGTGMKVMMVTTEADHGLIEHALDYGADEFLMKPFTPQSLREKLLLLGFALD